MRGEFKPRRRQKQFQNDAAPSGSELKPKNAEARPPPPRAFYYRKEVAEIIDRTWPCIWQWIREGKFPKPHMHGGRPIWLKSDIDAYFASLPECIYKPLETEDAA
jgi:predicted DNA-binding transcriptional regulator AlpA